MVVKKFRKTGPNILSAITGLIKAMNFLLLPKIILISTILPVLSYAQAEDNERGGLVWHIEGEVYLDGRLIEFPEDQYHEIKDGMDIKTGNGRTEIQLGPGMMLMMDENTLVRMDNSSFKKMSVRLEHGTIILEVLKTIKRYEIHIQFGSTISSFKRLGLYRIDGKTLKLRVFEGKAEIRNTSNKKEVKKGKSARLDTLEVEKFNLDLKDTFHKWAAKRSYVLFDMHGKTNGWKHWQPVNSGLFLNRGYGIAFYSEELFQKQEEILRKERNKIVIPIY